jgi:3D (Asp-Asp-Asp) domain-containing protein
VATAAVAWAVGGLLLAYGRQQVRRAEPATSPAARVAMADTASPSHAPVFVVGEWQHAPVRVVAAPPPAPALSPAQLAAKRADERRERAPALFSGRPRPFAQLKALASDLPAVRGLDKRARPGEPVHVVMSGYCLQGTTRSGTRVRTGIVAADPRIFPLGRHVELFAGGRFLGRFRVEDTGGKIRGTRIDIWTPDCADARRFGMRSGIAALVALGER